MISAPRRFADLASLIIALLGQTALGGMMPPIVVVDERVISVAGAAQSTSVDIWFDLSEPVDIPIAGFQLELVLVGPNDAVEFAGVTAPASHPYLFESDSLAPLFSVSDAGQRVTIGDFLDSGLSEIQNGRGLASLQLSVQPEAIGNTYEINIETDPNASFLATSSSDFIPYLTNNGRITVVPEPTSIVSCLAVAWTFCGRNRVRSGSGVGNH
jgi:hypothetical protein